MIAKEHFSVEVFEVPFSPAVSGEGVLAADGRLDSEHILLLGPMSVYG